MEETICYQSPLGDLEICTSGEAITRIHFLKEYFPAENGADAGRYISPKSVILKKCTQQLDDYFSGKNLVFDLPLDQTGTEFQKKVWDALVLIKHGHTLSYLELSKKLGDVKAIRAVGSANGRNNIAIVVPCHRVIGSNGNLVGYAGELWRKQWLLRHEAKYCNGVQTLF